MTSPQSDEALIEELERMHELAIEGTPEDADRFAHELRENSHSLLALARQALDYVGKCESCDACNCANPSDDEGKCLKCGGY